MEIQTGDGKNGLENLEVDEMSVISETEHELSEEYFPEVDKQQSSYVLATEESEAEGQVVPKCQSTHLREVLYKEGTDKEECLTVPQIEIDGKPVDRLEKQNELAEDYRKEDKYLLKQQDQFAKIIENTKEELCVNTFQWPPLGITDETVKNVINKPDMLQQFLLGKNDERSASVLSTTCTSIKPATMSDMEPINTTEVMEDEGLRPEEPKIQLSSIFKRDTEVARGEETAMHFPEIMSNIEPINTTVAMEDEDLHAEEPKIQLSSIFKRDTEVARGEETAVHFPDGMSNMKPILVNTALEDEDPAEKPKLSSILKRDTKAARGKETTIHFPEDMNNTEPILVNTAVALKDEYLPGDPKIQLPSILKEDHKAARGKETAVHFPEDMSNTEPILVNTAVALKDGYLSEDPEIQLPSILKEDTKAARGKETTVHFPEDMSNMEHVNTTVALPLEDEDLPEEPKLSSILKRDTKADRCKETAVHFPEDIVSVRFYDISDDDSDTDTVILSDTEENLTTDQQVPSNTFYGSFDNDYCIPNRSYLSYKCSDFKPQFSFPPAIKISNYQLFNSLDDEEQMIEEMEIGIDNELDIVNIESQGEEYEYHDDQSAGTEKMAIWKKPLILEFTNFKEQAAVGNVARVTELTESQEGTHEFYNDQSNAIEKRAVGEDLIIEFAHFKEHDAVDNIAEVTESTEFQEGMHDFHNDQSIIMEKKVTQEDPVIEFAQLKEEDAFTNTAGVTELTEFQEGMHEFHNDQSIIMEKKATQEDPVIEFAQLKEEDAITNTAGVTESTEYQSEIDEFDKEQSSSTEKLTIGEGQAAEFAHCMERRIAEIHADGISEDNSVLDNCARKCESMEIAFENCGDDKKIIFKDAVQESPSEFNVECRSSLEGPWTTNDSKIGDAIPHLEEQKDIENQEIKDSRMRSHAIITSVPDQTPFPGGCGSRFLRRRPVSIDTLLINEDLAMSTFKESIRPTKILQTITEEDMVFYDERIIDVVTHETNILNLSQEKFNCVYVQPQCHEKPKKAVISSLVSSPDHFNTLDFTWESSVDLSPRNYRREESIVKSTINDKTSSEDNSFTALGDLRCGRIRTGEEVDFYEDRVSISGTASIKPEKHIWAKRPEKCVVPVYQTCPDNNPPCPVLMYPMISPKHTQKRLPQIVPEIEARESKISRKHLTTQSNNTSLHAVPSELDDVMDFDASFHSDDHSFPEHKISGGCDTSSKVNENHTNIEERKSVSQTSVFTPTSASHSSETVFLTRQGRNRLRVGLSKSTRVKPLHPYWSKSRIK